MKEDYCTLWSTEKSNQRNSSRLDTVSSIRTVIAFFVRFFYIFGIYIKCAILGSIFFLVSCSNCFLQLLPA